MIPVEILEPPDVEQYCTISILGISSMGEAKTLYDLDYTIIRPSALYGNRCISGRVTQKFIENALSGAPLSLEGGGGGKLVKAGNKL